MSTSVAATDKFLRKEIQNEERRKQVKLLALSFLFRLQQIKQKRFCRKIHFGFRSECDIDCVYSCTSLYKMTNETFKGCHSSKVIESLSTFLFNVVYCITIVKVPKWNHQLLSLYNCNTKDTAMRASDSFPLQL